MADKDQIRKILFDEAQRAPIKLTNGKDAVSFEQVFALEDGDLIYCILKPLFKIEGMTSQAAIVFAVDDKAVFKAVTGPDSERIFDCYYKALSAEKQKG